MNARITVVGGMIAYVGLSIFQASWAAQQTPPKSPQKKPINPFIKKSPKNKDEAKKKDAGKKPVNPFAKNSTFGKKAEPKDGPKGGGTPGVKSPFGTPKSAKPSSPFGKNKSAPGSRNGTSPFGVPATKKAGSTSPPTNPFAKPKQPGPDSPFAARVNSGSTSSVSGKRVKYTWRVGAVVEAKSGLAGRLWGTVAVPSDWPEQTVKVVKREVTPHVRGFKMRKLRDDVEQMYFEIPRLAPGEKATALLTYEIEKQPVTAPEGVETFQLPKRPPRKVAKHLGASPYIESRHTNIRKKAKELTESHPTGYGKAKAIYDFVRDEIELRQGGLKGALKTLDQGNGQKEDLICLFIALCRSSRIPARTVWVPNHAYAEFYLVDADEQGYWLPCELVGEKHFAETPDVRPILQRGDSFDVPEKKTPQRFVAELLKGKAGGGLAPPTHRFVRELTTVPIDE